MQKDTKVCIIFFGLPRNTDKTSGGLTKYLIEPLKKDHQTDVLSCLNYQKIVKNARSDENAELDDSNYSFFREHTLILINPDDHFDPNLHAELMRFGDGLHDGGVSVRNHLLQLYTIKRAFEAAKEIDDYDIYVFMRPDICIHEEVPLAKFIRKYKDTNTVLVPFWQGWAGVNDRLCLATRHSAPYFAERYGRALDWCKKSGRPVIAEEILLDSFITGNVNIKTCDTKMSRVRVDGKMMEETYDIREGFSSWERAFSAQLSHIDLHKALIGTSKLSVLYVKERLRRLARRLKKREILRK
jgi:hypothetical protein